MYKNALWKSVSNEITFRDKKLSYLIRYYKKYILIYIERAIPLEIISFYIILKNKYSNMQRIYLERTLEFCNFHNVFIEYIIYEMITLIKH